MLDLLFQGDEGKIVVIVADAKFFPRLHAVPLFPQGLVLVVVKIDASDRIPPRLVRVGVPLHERPQALGEGQAVG